MSQSNRRILTPAVLSALFLAAAPAAALTVGSPVPTGVLEAVGQTVGGGCTATLVAPRMVLTAAHCVQGGTRSGIVLHDVVPAGRPGTRQDVTVMGTVRIHPEFGQRGWLREDVAVIDLDQPASALAPGVAPIPLEAPSVTPLAGDGLTLVGFGRTGPTCSGAAQGKRSLALTVTEANFAAIHFDVPGQSTCAGDSGGPVLNGRGRVVGVASHAATPGTPGRHSWYRPTAFSYNWVFGLPRRSWTACGWVPVQRGGMNSHAQGPAWCPNGTYLVQLDLDGDRNLDPHDAPVIGQAKCCALAGAAPGWASCAWTPVQRRGANSHAKRPDWCAEGAYLTALDLDGDRQFSANDTPVVGAARCCTPADASAGHWGSMYWIDVEHRGELAPRNLNSHAASPPEWCLEGAFLTQLDLDGNRAISDHDAPVVGAVKCARPRP